MSKSDWALIVPIPASIATNREVLSAEFGGTVPLVHCLRSVLTSAIPTADAVVAVAAALCADVEALLATYGLAVPIVAVAGRGTRVQCLAAGLAGLGPGIRYVLVHDIRRPLASTDLAGRVVDALRRGSDVVLPALALVDSVKSVDGAGAVTATVDRTLLRSAQFPRGFQRHHLATVLARAEDDDFDELMVARRAGLYTTVIDGDPDAFALDIPRDVELADAIYARRDAEQR